MIRLLPFRQVNEYDVINLFALEGGSVNENLTGVGSGDAGVFVKVSTGNFDADPLSYVTNTYLGKTDYPHIGSASMYPQVNKTVALATSGELPLGLTLNQTAKYDENGESLLHYPQKRKEMQAVLPGQAVPIAMRGIFTLHANAFDGPASTYTIGGGIKMSEENAGKITGALSYQSLYLTGNTGQAVTDLTNGLVPNHGVFGTVLGTGSRSGSSTTSLADAWSGDFLVIKLG